MSHQNLWVTNRPKLAGYPILTETRIPILHFNKFRFCTTTKRQDILTDQAEVNR